MRRLLVVLTTLVVLGAGGAVAFSRWGGGDAEANDEEPTASEVVEVERRTLTDAERVSGDLGYDEAAQVAADRADGVLTWLPAEGRTLEAGDVAYRVDEEPVVLLIGRLPLYRELSYGVDNGADVRQLERNLKRLGYDPGTVNNEFTGYTEDAVQELQEDHGLDETGVVTATEFLVLPESIRVGTAQADVGATLMPGTPTPLYDATSTRRVVTVDLDPSDEALVEVGARATVTLPDGSTLDAEVSEVGTVATPTESESESEEASAEATLPVTLTLADNEKAEGLSAAPVTVDLTRERRKQVLTVPVTALVALAEGGFAVRREGGELVAVETGLYSDGYVEVASGLAEGDRIEVPTT
ncbi:MAG TPA: peptidoglycan-binding domain-containing protein [Nocardioides sp.]|nr:peptidoglycan-binding domain-containing protein [Nocardioides sp.]